MMASCDDRRPVQAAESFIDLGRADALLAARAQRCAKEKKAQGDRECRHCYGYESEHANMRSHKFEPKDA